MITMLIGVDNILNKINWLSLHLLYVYYFMLCILVYQFELYGIMRIMYQHLKYFLVTFYEGQNGDDVCAHLGFTSPVVKHSYP